MLKARFLVGDIYHFVGFQRECLSSDQQAYDDLYGGDKGKLRRVVFKSMRCIEQKKVGVVQGTAQVDGYIFSDLSSEGEFHNQFPLAQYRQDSIDEDFVVRGSEGFSGVKLDLIYSRLERKVNRLEDLTHEESLLWGEINRYICSEQLKPTPTELSLKYPELIRSFTLMHP